MTAVIRFGYAQIVRRIFELLDNDVSWFSWDGSYFHVAVGGVVVVCEISLE